MQSLFNRRCTRRRRRGYLKSLMLFLATALEHIAGNDKSQLILVTSL